MATIARAAVSTASINAELDAFATIYDLSVIDVYTGTKPTSANNAFNGGTLLGQYTTGGAAYNESTGANGLQFGTAAAGALPIKTGDTWSMTSIAVGEAGYAVLRTKGDPGTADTTETWPRYLLSIGVTSGDLRVTQTNFTAIGLPSVVQSITLT